MKIKSRTVVVTGASSGLGRATALALARRGANLALVARRAELLEQTAQELREHGVRAVAIPCDVSDGTAVIAALARVRSALGEPDILVNAAGIGIWKPFLDITEAEHREMMDVNYWGSFHWIRAVLPGMRARGCGQIVNVSSGSGKVAFSVTGGYSASKFALTGLSESLHRELLGSGVVVSCLHPGSIRTAFWSEERTPARGLPALVRLAPRLSPDSVARSICLCITFGFPIWNTPLFLTPLIKANALWIRLGDLLLSRWFLPGLGALLAGRILQRLLVPGLG